MRKRSLVLVSLTALATLAHAGPPLVCHAFDTGGAKSLPWAASANWNSPDRSYDLKRLIPDTLSLLSPETPVVVRMETMRRASIYANKDPRIAYELLSRLMARALESESSLALFDAGYLAETYKQVHMADRAAGYVPLAAELNGYAWVVKAIRPRWRHARDGVRGRADAGRAMAERALPESAGGVERRLAAGDKHRPPVWRWQADARRFAGTVCQRQVELCGW